jgi:hypothetical protein
MDAIEKLIAIEDIKLLKARYFRYVDTKQYDKLEQLFTPDVKADHSEDHPSAKHTNRKDWVEMIKSAMHRCTSMHHGHQPEIEITSPTTAKGIWPMQDWVYWPEGERSPLGDNRFVGFGAYHETYEKTDAGWQIKTVTLKRVKIERS